MESIRTVRALVVDPNEVTGTAHRKRLEDEGYKVVLAADAVTAAALARKSPPSIIFVNLDGDSQQGSSVIEALKSDRTTRHIPVRLLTRSYDQGPGKKNLTTVARNAW